MDWPQLSLIRPKTQLILINANTQKPWKPHLLANALMFPKAIIRNFCRQSFSNRHQLLWMPVDWKITMEAFTTENVVTQLSIKQCSLWVMEKTIIRLTGRSRTVWALHGETVDICYCQEKLKMALESVVSILLPSCRNRFFDFCCKFLIQCFFEKS